MMLALFFHKYKGVWLFFSLSFSVIVGAQTNKGLSYLYQEKLRTADEHFKHSNYSEALDIYKEVIQKTTEDTAIVYKIANCYRLLKDSKNSEDWYRKGISISDSTINPVYKLYFAQVLTINEKYSEALFWYKEYYKISFSDVRAFEAIKSLENLSRFYYDTTFFVISPVSINTKSSEFCPTIYKNGILYLSDRDNIKSGFLSWYFSASDSFGSLSQPVKFNKGIKAEYNEGPMSFYDDFRKMIYSQNYTSEKVSKGKINEIPLQLFSAQQDNNNKWVDIQQLPFDKKYSFTQPYITPDGKTLYYSSNMEGGYGGIDLYISKFDNGTWTQPKNLGSKINTAGDEVFPYIFHDSILYFSSNGHGGLGGLDIFKMDLLRDTSKINNLGIPLNSANDDFGLVFNTDGLSGYIASNRANGMGADDIYGFKLVRMTLSIKIIDQNTSLPVSNANIYNVDATDEKPIGVTDQQGSCLLVIPICKVFRIKIAKDNYESKIYEFQPIKSFQSNSLPSFSVKAEIKQVVEEKVILTDNNNNVLDNPKNVIYKVQIGASRMPIPMKDLKKKYRGNLKIESFYEDRWYKYSIGEYATYTEAKKLVYSSAVYDAFIIAYVNKKRVYITIAKTATDELGVERAVRQKH